jgi:hypothetical protein
MGEKNRKCSFCLEFETTWSVHRCPDATGDIFELGLSWHCLQFQRQHRSVRGEAWIEAIKEVIICSLLVEDIVVVLLAVFCEVDD